MPVASLNGFVSRRDWIAGGQGNALLAGDLAQQIGMSEMIPSTPISIIRAMSSGVFTVQTTTLSPSWCDSATRSAIDVAEIGRPDRTSRGLDRAR